MKSNKYVCFLSIIYLNFFTNHSNYRMSVRQILLIQNTPYIDLIDVKVVYARKCSNPTYNFFCVFILFCRKTSSCNIQLVLIYYALSFFFFFSLCSCASVSLMRFCWVIFSYSISRTA